jgi:hypothetical protein
LIEWDKNPATISEKDAKQLARSLDKFDHVLPYIAAAPKNGKAELPLLDGHQRKMVELSLRKVDPKTLVDVRVPSRPLKDKERAELSVRLRRNVGQWDGDALLNWFESDDLEEWGMSRFELSNIGFEFEGVDPNEEWRGMPEFEQRDLSAYQSIHVHFKSQADVDKFSKLIKQKISEKTRALWYPEAEKINMRDTYES